MPVFWSSVSKSSANSRLSSARPSVEGSVEALVDGPLGRGQRQRRAGGELAGHRHRRRVDLVVGDDGVGQADLQRLLGAHVPAGEDQVLGLRRADQPGQPLGAAGAGDDAEQDLRLADLGRGAQHPEVGAQRQLVAAAEGVAGDAAMTGLGIRATAVKEAVSSRPQATMLGAVELGHRLDVGAGGEHPLAAVEDDGPDVVARAASIAAARTSRCSCSSIAFIFGRSSRMVPTPSSTCSVTNSGSAMRAP